jgi:hypothetical protein
MPGFHSIAFRHAPAPPLILNQRFDADNMAEDVKSIHKLNNDCQR